MNQVFNVVIVGLGRIGFYYDFHHYDQQKASYDYILTHSKACIFHPGFNFLGAVDISSKVREDFKFITSLDSFSNIDSFISHKVDLVIISTPSHIRTSILLPILAMNPKLILFEKPLALTLIEAEEVLSLCYTKGIKVGVNYFRRFNQGMKDVKTIIHKQVYGRVLQGFCYYSGGFLNNGSHIVDLLVFYLGLPCRMKCIAKETKEDEAFFVTCVMQYEFFDIYIFPSKLEHSQGSIHLFFERGKLSIEDWGEKIQFYTVDTDPYFPGYSRLFQFHDQCFENHHLLKYQYEVLESVYQCLIHGSNLDSNGQTAYETLKLCWEVLA